MTQVTHDRESERESEREYSVAKMYRMPYLDTSFSAEEPYNYWLFCEKRPAT